MNYHSLAASVLDITLDEILSIKHPSTPHWSRCGQWLGFLWNDGGLTDLFTCSAATGEVRLISSGNGGVSSLDWGPCGHLAYSQGGNLYCSKQSGDSCSLTEGDNGDTEPHFSADGRYIAFSRRGNLFIHDSVSASLRHIPLPGSLSQGSDGVSIRWSPGCSRLAVTVLREKQRDLVVVSFEGRILWDSNTADNESSAFWLDEDRLHYTLMDLFHYKREHRLLNLRNGEDLLLCREESQKAMKDQLVPVARPGHNGVAYVLTPGNWPHIFYLNLDSMQMTQLSDGECDDTGHAEDVLSFSPDGSRLLYSSNRGVQPNQRRIWEANLEQRGTRCLTDVVGTDSCCVWSPDGKRIAFARCTAYQSKDLFLMDQDGRGVRRLTTSMPESLTPEKVTVPTHVTYPSTDGLQVHADLYLPKGFVADKKYPAIIFVHGGMSRQMRHGWHPLQGYSIFHSFHQYLLHRGYVILSVDYRGSIGYGREYEEGTYMCICNRELADVAEGATYLEQLGYVAKDSIAVYGISYGGFLTLGAMTKYADRFALGINIAGIWDWEQYATWNLATHPGRPWFGGFGRLGGPRAEHNKEAWFEASPRNFVQGLKGPVLNLMGTADMNVDYRQMDSIHRDLVKHNKDFASMFYPGEVHVFTYRRTWEDAFPRMALAFDRYLKVPRAERPRAMI